MSAHDEATQAQVIAMAPDRSTWLSANAGSGKTRVLTARVALLLLGGTVPQNILCLTYTKAAASEMQNRLFKQLGAWAMMADRELADKLTKLGVSGGLDAGRLDKARTLFAAAIETPGGLRIQTIHSFCGALLRRFPLEADVTPLFRELDDRATRDLHQTVLRQMAGGEGRAALRAMARHVSDADLTGVTRAVAGNRAAYARPRSGPEIRASFGLPPEPRADAMAARLFTAENLKLIADLTAALTGSGTRDQETAAKLRRLNTGDPGDADIDILVAALLFGAKTANPFGAKVTGSHAVMAGAVRNTAPELARAADDFMELVADTRRVIHAERAAARTVALENFAQAFLAGYGRVKSAGGWLDFDDLIEKATALLSNKPVAQWVKFRLDGGIDHVLVDEAQDTSREQWRVIRKLTKNFGIDATDSRERTVFVVGDPKQSIYSFQGADPDEFDNMRDHYSRRLTQHGRQLHNRSLRHSFRSSPAILKVVDTVFASLPHSGFDAATHVASRASMPGRVDVWPVHQSDNATPDIAWNDPQDLLAPQDDKVVLARRIAAEIARICACEAMPDDNGGFRPAVPGDFLILVQRRSALFNEIIRACKAAGLPVAGADRLKLAGELAVKDLKAILSFCALPQDDLSLAAALRSPLFGFSEQQLFDLAHRRGDSQLWQEVERRRDEFPEIHGMLRDLLAQADFLAPFEFLERILTRWGGRVALLSRLGPEAAEGIDALLSLAQDFEDAGPASITTFLAWLDADETEIKRQAEAAGDKIRVMTTHGAKGLESAIVILPETQELRAAGRTVPVVAEGAGALWPSPGGELTETGAAASTAQSRKREEERLRLLYVAMTRAEKWLIVCGVGKEAARDCSWHSRVWKAVCEAGASSLEIEDIGAGLRHQFGHWQAPDRPAADDAALPPALPGWARETAPPPPPRPAVINPSSLGDDKSLGGADDAETEFAKSRGTAIHLLLQELPPVVPDLRPATANALLGSRCLDLPPRFHDAVRNEALAVLDNPDFGPIFAADTFAEVAVSASASTGERIAGIIDRLILEEDRVTVVDYKSNARPPARAEDVPEGILTQMAAYREAIEQIYPGRKIELQILWTAIPALTALPLEIVMNAARAATTP